MKFIAHRGACLEYQEDTIAALEKAAQYGAFAVECDPRFTKDNVLIIFHDNDLSRLAGAEEKIIDLTYREVKEKLGAVGLTVNTFDEILSNYKGNSAVLFDLSFDADDESFFERLANAPFRAIAGVHTPDEAKLAAKHLSKENILAFMKKPEDVEDYINSGVGMIRLWEHWLPENPINEVRKRIPDDIEIWIMARDKNIHHPLFCMNGSKEQIEKLEEAGADGMLLNDIKLAYEIRINK